MANFFNKTKLPIAVTSRTKYNLDSQHVTTSTFMQMSVAKYMELVPKQSVEINHALFTRLDPLLLPTFGNAQIHNRCFFVPFRTIFRGWNDFIADTPHVHTDGVSEIIPNVPYILNETFINFFTQTDTFSNPVSAMVSNTEKYDFSVVIFDGSRRFYKFTDFGRLAYKLLVQLGYKFSFNRFAQDYFTPHSALPLLSLIKVYSDWYFPSTYNGTQLQNDLIKWINYENSDYYGDGRFCKNITATDLNEIFQVVSNVYYDSDYLTSAWDHPSSPNTGLSSDFSIDDISGNGSFVNNDSAYQTPVLDGSGITQYMISALRSLSDYMQRHKIVGSRTLDRYLSRFGVALSSEKLNRSVWVGDFNQNIEFGDVTSTSDTEGATLGAYAGKGLSYNNGTYSFNTDEYGMLLIISTIIPKVSYYQGRDRITKHLTKLDFFTPEFDALGVQAMCTDEVYLPMNASDEYAQGTVPDTNEARRIDYDGAVFGFVPRYAEYKVGKDLISGDYVLGSKNTGKEGWTLFRDVSDYFKLNGVMTSHSLGFLSGLDSNQYNRIFSTIKVGDQNFDNFNIIHNFNIKTSFPSKPLYDTYEFESEEQNADTVTVDVGGVRAN